MLEDLPDAGARARAACITQLLRQQLTSQGVAVDVFDPLAALLAACWARDLELMISDDGGTLALTTRVRGSDLLVRLGPVLSCCEIEPHAAVRMMSLAEMLAPRLCFLKLAFTRAGDPRPEVSLIQRRTQSANQTLQWLDLDSAASEQLQGCAALLGRSAMQGMALTVRAGAQPRVAVRFAQALTARHREDVRLRLAQAASRYAPCAAAVSCWAEHHDAWLVHEYTLLSLWLTPASMRAEVRIEYPEVPAAAAAGWLEERSTEVSERFAALCATAACARLSCLEVSLEHARLPRLHGAVLLECGGM